MSALTVALTVTESDRLAECEATIERGFRTFAEVGSALLEIRDSRLYRSEFGTFEDYCQTRWGMDRRNANRTIEAAIVVGELGSIDPKLAPNIVVILGDGKRKPWRNVTADDLRDMDRIRYHNYRKQAVAYDEWRESYDAVLPIVSRHGTVGTAASRGAFDHMAETAA